MDHNQKKLSGPTNQSLVWFITGCSSGFGNLFVPAILARGDKVIATARNASSLDEFKDSDNVRILQLDVTASPDELAAKAADAVDLFGRVDVLVNNAGYVLSGVWEEVSHDQVLDQMQTNLFGQMNVARAFLPHMRKRRAGTMVFMGSIAGWLGVAAGGPYSASKFALEGAVESLEKEVSPLGIRVHLMVLGQFQRQAETSGKQPGDPEKAVQRILDVVRREGSVAPEEELPLRIVLGSDAVQVIRTKCLETLKLLEDYGQLACSTDFPGARSVQDYK
ncbi:hypothetical protein BJY04DRAFT_231304 [Aspergillus karnatakaensis]|uniref:SDR family oxidoreductase n=1 Tax=Aspergillus karnatakaensis TaxID=1810916 RepID=UPI003CCCE8A2